MSATRLRPSVAVLAIASAILCAGCNDESPPPAPARFNQPNRVDFACFDGDSFQVLPRSECTKAGSKHPKYALNALVTQAGRGEIAVVDLRARRVLDSRRDIPGYTFVPVGEMPRAIVVPPEHPQQTYVADFGSRDVRVLRTRALVATVLDSPDAQRVSLQNPDGTGLLAPTDMVLAPDESALFVTVPDAALVLRLPIVRCGADADPSCEDGLIDEAGITTVALEEPGVPAAVTPVTPSKYEQLCEFERPELPEPTPVQLDADALEVASRPSALGIDAYCREGEACSPRLLVADGAQPVIHVLDLDKWASDPATALSTPLVTGAPTSAVVVTPRVPRTVEGEGETQYVYAIDAQDGSVMVLEDGQVLNVNSTPGERADRLSFTTGSQGATALEVMTPAFQPHGPAAQYVDGWTAEPTEPQPGFRADDPMMVRQYEDQACTDEDHDLEDPARLRGVFLAVAMTDGDVHVVDVHDMELQPNEGSSDYSCRECATITPPTDKQRMEHKLPALRNIPILVRNQERLQTSFVVETGEEPPSFTPTVLAFRFGVDGATYPIRTNGTSASPRAPVLDCIACNSALTQAYPVPGDEPTSTEPSGTGAPDAIAPDEITECGGTTPALLCIANDPWSSGADTWNAQYEGPLPAGGGHGHFVPPDPDDIDDANRTGGLELVADLDFCKAGVLGEEDIAGDYVDCDSESVPDNKVGDQLVITSRPLGRARLEQLERTGDDQLDICAELRAELDADDKLSVAFEIRRAYGDRLVLQTTLLRPIGKARTYDDVKSCYEDSFNFEVRTSQAFTVRGALSGFEHHVRANGANRCEIDASGDPLMRGRARLGCTFRNHSVQFKLRRADPDGVDATQRLGVVLQAAYSSRAIKLIFHANDLGFGAATVVPVQLRYSDVDRKLYLVDVNDRGLLPIPLDSFPPSLTSSGQYN
jgi:hypothetical protein